MKWPPRLYYTKKLDTRKTDIVVVLYYRTWKHSTTNHFKLCESLSSNEDNVLTLSVRNDSRTLSSTKSWSERQPWTVSLFFHCHSNVTQRGLHLLAHLGGGGGGKGGRQNYMEIYFIHYPTPFYNNGNNYITSPILSSIISHPPPHSISHTYDSHPTCTHVWKQNSSTSSSKAFIMLY